jgi:hypothetical protein
MQAFASLNVSSSWDYCGTVPELNVREGSGGAVRHIAVTGVSVLCRTCELIPQFVNRDALSFDFGFVKFKTRKIDS